MQAEGVDVANLSAGEPDFPTPPSIKQAGIDAIDGNFTRYTAGAGIIELREAISEKLKAENGLDYAPEQIVVSNGAKHAISNALLATVNPGEEVLYPVPGFPSYPEAIHIAGGTPVPYRLGIERSLRIDCEEIEAKITARTKLLIFNNPSNPLGIACTPDEVREIGALLAKQDIWALSDEIYERLRYDGIEHLPLPRVEGMYERTILVNGVSKTYSMTGWRIGFLAAPPELAKTAAKIQSQMTSSPCSISQKAALAAFSSQVPETGEMVAAFAKRRDLVIELLSRIPDITFTPPEGAFYAFPKVSTYYGLSAEGFEVADSVSLCRYLLEKHYVALVPGVAFGADEYIRLSFASSEEEITRGLTRLHEGLSELHL